MNCIQHKTIQNQLNANKKSFLDSAQEKVHDLGKGVLYTSLGLGVFGFSTFIHQREDCSLLYCYSPEITLLCNAVLPLVGVFSLVKSFNAFERSIVGREQAKINHDRRDKEAVKNANFSLQEFANKVLGTP